jgi:hypothetical protein
MKSAIISIVVLVAFTLGLNGCGGSGSSSSTAETSPNTSSPENPEPPSSSEQFASLVINPLTELGLEAGNKACFSVKSYNNVSESDFSKAICGQIKNDNVLILSWNKVPEKVNGYYIYFGTDINNATNFLADVITS